MAQQPRPRPGDEAAVADARRVLSSTGAAPDVRLLGAVHSGLLAVEAEPSSRPRSSGTGPVGTRGATRPGTSPDLAVRRDRR